VGPEKVTHIETCGDVFPLVSGQKSPGRVKEADFSKQGTREEKTHLRGDCGPRKGEYQRKGKLLLAPGDTIGKNSRAWG